MLYCLNSNFLISCSLVLFSHIKGYLNINAHLSMKKILVEPNLVHTFFGNNLLILMKLCTPRNNYLLVRTKLGICKMLFFVLFSTLLNLETNFVSVKKTLDSWLFGNVLLTVLLYMVILKFELFFDLSHLLLY